MKILALDLGDRWVGSATSDPLGITCKPYETTELHSLFAFLERTLKKESIKTIVIGYPKTFSGTESEQTKKVLGIKESIETFLQEKYPKTTCVLWDERLSSKRSQETRHARTPQEKQKSHSIAAAFILQSYLDFQAMQRDNPLA